MGFFLGLGIGVVIGALGLLGLVVFGIFWVNYNDVRGFR